MSFKLAKGIGYANGAPKYIAGLPTVEVHVDGVGRISALIDIGRTTTIADFNIVSSMRGNNEHVVTVDGSVVKCKVGCVSLTVDGQTIDRQCLVLNTLLKQIKLIIGMDIIHHLWSVIMSKVGPVEFKQCASKQTISGIRVGADFVLDIHDVDFDVKLDDKK